MNQLKYNRILFLLLILNFFWIYHSFGQVVSGISNVCVGIGYDYYVPYVAGATYSWSVPNNATVTAQVEERITIRWSLNSTGSSLSCRVRSSTIDEWYNLPAISLRLATAGRVSDATVCYGNNILLALTGTSNTTLINWQRKSGSSWIDIDATDLHGALSSSYYRAKLRDQCSSSIIYSSEGLITVAPSNGGVITNLSSQPIYYPPGGVVYLHWDKGTNPNLAGSPDRWEWQEGIGNENGYWNATSYKGVNDASFSVSNQIITARTVTVDYVCNRESYAYYTLQSSPAASTGNLIINNNRVCQNISALGNFSVVNANGDIQWYRYDAAHNSFISIGSGNSIPAPSLTETTTFKIVASLSGSLAESAFTIVVDKLPSKAINPAGSIKILSNSSIEISSLAIGDNNYRWKKDGSIIPGATSRSYTSGEEGVFSVVITSNTCSVESDNLTIVKNAAPIAYAGSDQNLAYPTTTTSLSGSATDSDGTIVSSAWSQIAGATVSFSNGTTMTTTLSNLNIGEYIFRLTVTDDSGETSSDDVRINVLAPFNNHNWIKETIVLINGVGQDADLNSLEISQTQKNINWNYFDGLGTPIQSISVQSSPSGMDVVQPIVYDDLGREKKKYLTYADGNNGWYKEDAITAVQNFYATANNRISRDTQPYTETTFEPSPLNRILKQGAPGTLWQPNTDIYSMTDNTIKKHYEFNGADEVVLFKHEATTGMVSVSTVAAEKYYLPNQLQANKTYDEKNNEMIEYVDKEGRTVCKKVYAKTESNVKYYAETYYIYDDLGNLVMVLPPEGVEKLKTTLNLN